MKTIHHSLSFPLRLAPLVLAAMLAMAGAHAQDAAAAAPAGNRTQIAQRHPAGSINSIETADQALAEVEAERARIEATYAQAQRDCYSKFFQTHCMDKAKEEHRVALARVHAVEVEANHFKRAAKVAERDRALTEKRATEQAEEATREQMEKDREAERERRQAEADRKLSEAEARSGSTAAKAAPKAAQSGPKPAHPSPRKERPAPSVEQQAEEARKREENVAAYEKKVKEAQEHEREVAQRKAEKDKERAAKGLPPLPTPTAPTAP